jgi:hypothetical protein
MAQANPGERFTALTVRLGALLARVDELLVQQVNGRAAVSRGSRRRRNIIRALVAGPLKHLVRIARAAAGRVPGVDRQFRLPRNRNTQIELVTIARNMVEEVERERNLFLEYGFTDERLAEVKELLAEYDRAVEAVDAGRRAHTGARAELEHATDQVMLIVRDLDAMVELRHRDDPEQLASWRSARNVHWPGGAPSAPGSQAKPSEPAA